MCGIAGIRKTSAPLSEQELHAMQMTLTHRGPDDCGLWIEGNLGFAHTRLSIQDLHSRAAQPFRTSDGSGVLVYNGEIYNFRELRAELEAEGITFRTESDTEVVLHALHQWGVEKAIALFNGMFALAYTDLRTNTLWLARDRIGIKPLFIADHDGDFYFASEQKALLAHPAIEPALCHQALMTICLYERLNHNETTDENTELFLPGHILHIQGNEKTWIRYFDPIEAARIPGPDTPKIPFDSKQAKFASLLESSVEAHLVSDAPLATLCSGGLDSGLVTAMTARKRANLVSYVADMTGMRGEEARRARIITEAVGSELRTVEIDRVAFLRALPEAIQANDQPLFFAQEVALLLISRQVSADGFKVLLSGDGADELFGGYTWHEEYLRRWRYLALRARWIPDIPLTRGLGRFIPLLAPVDLDREESLYATTHTPIDYMALSWNVIAAAGMGRTLRQRDLFQHFRAFPHPERAFLARNFEDIYTHMRESLNSKDKMTMSYGIEARVPFIENGLIEFGLNLPVEHRYFRKTRKALIHRTAAEWLPADVVDLPKIGFSAPPQLWIDALTLLEDGLLGEHLGWPKNRFDDIHNLLRRHPHHCFRLLGTEIWLRLRECGTDAQELGEVLVNLAER